MSCGASVGFLTRYDEELREPLVWRQGSQASLRVARGATHPLVLASPQEPQGQGLLSRFAKSPLPFPGHSWWWRQNLCSERPWPEDSILAPDSSGSLEKSTQCRSLGSTLWVMLPGPSFCLPAESSALATFHQFHSPNLDSLPTWAPLPFPPLLPPPAPPKKSRQWWML